MDEPKQPDIKDYDYREAIGYEPRSAMSMKERRRTRLAPPLLRDVQEAFEFREWGLFRKSTDQYISMKAQTVSLKGKNYQRHVIVSMLLLGTPDGLHRDYSELHEVWQQAIKKAKAEGKALPRRYSVAEFTLARSVKPETLASRGPDLSEYAMKPPEIEPPKVPMNIKLGQQVAVLATAVKNLTTTVETQTQLLSRLVGMNEDLMRRVKQLSPEETPPPPVDEPEVERQRQPRRVIGRMAKSRGLI
jgi:hypothetical protein